MRDQLTVDFAAELADRLFSSPELANCAIAQLWEYLPLDIRDVVTTANCQIATAHIGCKAYRSLLFEYSDANHLQAVENLDRLAKILKIAHELMGLRVVISVYQGHGIKAEIDDTGRYVMEVF